MPFNESLTATRQALPKPEILKYPLETNVIDSAVILAAGVTADATGPYTGRRYLLAGTVLSKTGANNTYVRYTGAGGQTVDAILFDTVEFASAAASSNEPVAILRRNASFDATKIVDYVANQVAIDAWADANNIEII
jgi:hypothetical protein